MTKTSDSVLRAVVSALAVVALVIHVRAPHLIDAIGAGLIIIGLLPWLSSIIKSIEVTGVGKLELQVKEVTEKQTLLQEELDGLRFVVSGFVTDWEFVHLTKLASEGPVEYVRGPNRDDGFVNELVRLRDFGLVEKLVDFSLYDIPLPGDLKTYLRITERGRTYLRLRQELES
jgi:hypothetical protein